MRQDTKHKSDEELDLPFVPAYVMLGDGHQIKVNANGMIVASTDRTLIGKRYGKPSKAFLAEVERRRRTQCDRILNN